jgi:hypothetical protein
MKTYPANVMEEWQTLRHLLETRKSLARYGDGEFKIAYGGGCVSQVPDAALTARLAEILRTPQPGLLLAIPRIVGRHDMSPRAAEFWARIASQRAYVDLLGDGIQYGSAFVTRLDNAAHIDADEYWRMVQALFAGDRVVVVAGQYKGATLDILSRATVREVINAPGRDAWAVRDALFERCMAHPVGTTYYLSCGPTATVLAADLCATGRRALDMGAMHRFWKGGKLRRKEAGECKQP